MNRMLGGFLGSVLLLTSATWAARLTVSKDGTGCFTTIQAAVNAAKSGDEIFIMDNAIYQEQVTFDSAFNLSLKSSNPAGVNKPTILWKDEVNVGPKSYQETLVEEMITFDDNGALRIRNSEGIIIDGIKVDGGKAFTYGYPAVWKSDNNTLYSLQYGNTAVLLNRSEGVLIKNCEIVNAFMGLYVNDCNPGGLFFHPYPAVTEKNVTPMSGFGKTGNHIFEFNRIHHNSFGMFFECLHDMGSTVRCNLFYENHHSDDTLANTVKELTADGYNLIGGALFFKDAALCPVAIYNNTFWHNYLVFCGNWMPGSQHLIFNNIFAQPNSYWSDNRYFPSPWQAMDQSFVNRLKNCVYAAQCRPAGVNPNIINIMNVISIKSDEVIQQGHLISDSQSGVFPADADVRWLETQFKSIDPASSDFLVPDWDDSLIQKYVLNKGYTDAGILDNDGSPADLGAIPSIAANGNDLFVEPLSSVSITGTSASFEINVLSRNGSISSPTIKYIRWIDSLVYDDGNFGYTTDPISKAMINQVEVPEIKMGLNKINIQIPSGSGMFGFFEIIIQGTDQDGKPVFSNVGFIPYRNYNGGNGNKPTAINSSKKITMNSQSYMYTFYDLSGRIIGKIQNENQNFGKESHDLSKFGLRGAYIVKMVNQTNGKVQYQKTMNIKNFMNLR